MQLERTLHMAMVGGGPGAFIGEVHRKAARMLGYLLYVGDRGKTDLPYQAGSDGKDHWYRVRNEEAVSPEGIVRQAEAASSLYGFNDFKLKGGVMSGAREMDAVAALKARIRCNTICRT